jgi:HEAT repeat protein
MFIEEIFIGALAVTLLAWAGLSAYILAVQRQRTASRMLIADAIAELRSIDVRVLPLAARVARAKPLLNRASRSMVMHAAAFGDTPPDVLDAITSYLLARWGEASLRADAGAHTTSREKWRRMAALRILAHRGDPEIITLLARAVADPDTDLAAVALTLLADSPEPAAVDVMIDALRARRHAPSRVAMHLEHSRQLIADRLVPLLSDADPMMRLWGATLLGRYTEVHELEDALAPLTEDPNANVRAAAIESLGKIGNRVAASAALKLLRDDQPFVRAHAARALGELNRPDLAAEVSQLLADSDWWVRRAAKDSLEMMGSDVWPVLVRCLDHGDAFVRNGAAEVFQNLGILDNLIIMEAATDDPSSGKIDMLRRIAGAGGVRLTDSLIERAGPSVQPRVRELLATIGLQRVGA